jgi:predicted TIM-barrel fold metal-dependent hydrolase
LLLIDFGQNFADETSELASLYQIHQNVMLKHPDRFIVFGGADPTRGDAGLELFEKSVRYWGFRGLKLYPPSGFSPSDNALFPYYDICQSYGVPVLTHVGPTSPQLSFRYTRPDDVEIAAFTFPKVDFILAHAGVVWYEEAGLLAEYRPNIYLDLSGFQTEVRRNSFDSILFRHKQRGLLHKLMFGTDWPIHRLFGGQRKWVDALRGCAEREVVTNRELDQMLYANAAEVLKIR